jgi:hypothetical protein
MSRHRIVSHHEVKHLGKMIDKLTLRQIIIIESIIMITGITVSVALINPIPIVVAGVIAFLMNNRVIKLKD